MHFVFFLTARRLLATASRWPVVRRWLASAIVLLAAWPAAAQGTLRGTVRDSLTHQPLPFASVFLANTARGATTDAQGHYALAGVPAGHYELAATYLGYQLSQRAVAVGPGVSTFSISLLPAAQALAEVVVRPNPNRAADYQRFLELFLGTSAFARQCRVRDPDAVRLDYDAERRLLTATVPHALEVDNLALGYRLTFYDLDFRAAFTEDGLTLKSLSHLAFRELPGSAARQRRWAANRARAYRGSCLHFLRSVYTNTVAEEGFEVQRLRRVPNRRRAAADSLLRARRLLAPVLDQASVPDSIWQLLKQPRSASYLYKPLLPPDSLRRTAEGQVWLRFRDWLAVTYPQAHPDANYSLGGPAHGQTSILHFLEGREALLDASGTTTNPLALALEGYWAFLQMGDSLPLDYLPPPTTKR